MILIAPEMYAEEVITTKPEEPDGFYGFRIGGVISPSYGQRIRDGASGVSNAGLDDKTGFSSPWTLVTITKEWQESGLTLEVWGELLRSSQLSADTKVDSGTKSNPYLLGIRRAALKKTWETNLGTYSVSFGMQELPHTYTQWQNYWRWRYLDKGPLESLGFASQPADLGLGLTGKWGIVSAQAMISNGEGYRETQNTESSGLDASSRLSIEPKIGDQNRLGLHFFTRMANFNGAAGNECREGKSSCLPSDSNPATTLQKDVRSLESESYAVEANYDRKTIVNFGLGAIWRKQKGGDIRDRAQPYSPVIIPGLDTFGSAAYAWLSLGNEKIRMIGRWEAGSGRSGVMAADRSDIHEFAPGIPETAYWKSNVASVFQGNLNSSGYSSRSSFKKYSVYLEWTVIERFRIALGYVEVRNQDSNGQREKNYVDQNGDLRTRTDYLGQFKGSVPYGISEYSALDRQLFLRSTLEF
ncbi:hypothetical protein CH373_08560 [Leptospira perolatii]|uniref:Porin n=2 Tax=Leptospira perolatii TaxID=2023191 RepID=A0A2M9ZNX7_9LEPT|nr:hypothetical protein CH360_15055 [Leptospira perolatii]PJZ73691.1 hypothetical protein CH373_08560 [Leptospira perolatii]